MCESPADMAHHHKPEGVLAHRALGRLLAGTLVHPAHKMYYKYNKIIIYTASLPFILRFGWLTR